MARTMIDEVKGMGEDAWAFKKNSNIYLIVFVRARIESFIIKILRNKKILTKMSG